MRTWIAITLAGLILAAAPRAQGEATPPAAPPPDTEPKWELGVFLGAGRLPLYKGSDDYKVYLLPVPFLIYRGDWVQADRDGLRGILFRTFRFESTVSLSGHPPVDDEGGARDGMPELLPLVEAGPALKWWPLGKEKGGALFMKLAVRGTVSLDVEDDFATDYEGLRSELSLNYSRSLPDPRWRVGGSLSAFAGSRDQHGYFYDVPERYATEKRPAYRADAGYSGCGVSLFLTRKLRDKLTAGLYVRWDHLGGAAFEDSPLVIDEDNVTLGAALIWRFLESERRVPRRPGGGGM